MYINKKREKPREKFSHDASVKACFFIILYTGKSARCRESKNYGSKRKIGNCSGERTSAMARYFYDASCHVIVEKPTMIMHLTRIECGHYMHYVPLDWRKRDRYSERCKK